ncbi:hypothetical protein A33M_4154 [Rhodovulum sp. PH10]|nr:hypothetical protein A33M_4154 [Rhodovulum sp. PH10]
MPPNVQPISRRQVDPDENRQRHREPETSEGGGTAAFGRPRRPHLPGYGNGGRSRRPGIGAFRHGLPARSATAGSPTT